MKAIYIVHPYAGDGSVTPEENRRKIDEIVRRMALKNDNIAILSPTHMYSFLSVRDEHENRIALKQCLGVVRMADEVHVFGDYRTSWGCMMEIRCAQEAGKTIRYEDGTVEGGAYRGS
jgi:hypothetical protein